MLEVSSPAVAMSGPMGVKIMCCDNEQFLKTKPVVLGLLWETSGQNVHAAAVPSLLVHVLLQPDKQPVSRLTNFSVKVKWAFPGILRYIYISFSKCLTRYIAKSKYLKSCTLISRCRDL